MPDVDHIGCGHLDEQYEVIATTMVPAEGYRPMWACKECGRISGGMVAQTEQSAPEPK